LSSRRVILCVGSGGVGKTTTTAALGLAAAALGKRALCLTIDPAHRLAESLGLSQMMTEAQRIDPARLEQAGVVVRGSLTVMMLDTKSTFDELIARHASSPEVRDRILQNKLYRHISTSLAGTQEYMAMEKLHALKKDPRWDLIVVDTPPTSNALDFLDAPDRMIDALDSAVLRWLSGAFQTSGKLVSVFWPGEPRLRFAAWPGSPAGGSSKRSPSSWCSSTRCSGVSEPVPTRSARICAAKRSLMFS